MLVTIVTGSCPHCGEKDSFGNVDVLGTHLWQGCKKCGKSVKVDLPPIKKKILYLDQFFYSDAFKGQSTQFTKAAELIERLSNIQLLVAPFSSIHEDETHLWEHREELYKFIKSTSRGHEFIPAYNVQRNQIRKGFKAWLNGEPNLYILDESDALRNNIHKWDSYFRIDVRRYTGDVELIRDLKRQSIEGLIDIFDDWRISDSSFDDDVKSELQAAAEGYIKSYTDHIIRLNNGDFAALFDSPIMSFVIEELIQMLPADTSYQEKYRQCIEYLYSSSFANLPYHSIQATTYATLKDMVKNGAYTNKEKAIKKLRGFFYDINHIATYAPYCDAFIMDKPMAELMRNPKIALEERFRVKIFSLNNWDELFEWLDGIETSMSAEHKKALSQIYS